MAKPRLHESSAIVLMLLFIIATGVISQERKSVQQRILVRERITSVVVRDADGTFVKGLTPADFRILIDGKSVQVRAVMEHQQVNPDSPELADFALKYREAVKEGHVPPESPAPPRHIIFVFDSYNSGPKSIRSAKESALTLLNEIVIPGDNVLVFELNNGMRHLAGPTSDIAVLAEAIESVTNLSSNPLYKPQIEELRVPSTQSQVMQLKSLYLEKITRFKNYVKLLQGLTHALSVLPGRKTYLIFSEGANIYNPLEYTRGVLDLMRQEGIMQEGLEGQVIGDLEGAAVLDSVTTAMSYAVFDNLQLSTGQVREGSADSSSTFYTIRRGTLQPEWVLATDLEIRSSAMTNIQRLNDMERSRIDSLRDMARLTGGTFYDAGMSIGQLADTLKDEIGNYYEVSFSLPEQEAGRFYKLTIELPDHPEYRLVFNGGFTGHKPYEEFTEEEKNISFEAALLLGKPRNDLNAIIRRYDLPIRGNPGTFYYMEFDSSRLTLSESGEFELECLITVLDSKRRLRFRKREIYRNATELVSGRLWLLNSVPLIAEGGIFSIALQESSTGKLVVNREEIALDISAADVMSLSDPVFIHLVNSGSLLSWNLEEADDKVPVFEPLSFTGMRIPGKPNAINSIEQGSSAYVFFIIGGVEREIMDNISLLQLEIAVPTEDGTFWLRPDSIKPQVLKSINAIGCLVLLPVGVVPVEKGKLIIGVRSRITDDLTTVSVPFVLSDYSQDRAEELKKDTRIIFQQ